jgi:hypothetical protein
MRKKAKSISLSLAALTLSSVSFLDKLPIIKLWTYVRIPVRANGKIVLSTPGYDPLSGVYTSPEAPQINESMSLEEAQGAWRSLLSEFCFPLSGKTALEEPDPRLREPERERCISVALAAALTPFCLYLLPEKSKRPGFAASANSEGAGKTLLLSIGMVALLGYVPVGSAPKDEEEMRKVLDSVTDSGLSVLFLDNLKHHINSGELESFITSSMRRYRRLGSTNYVEAENLTTVYLTANFATYSPDLRRRLLSIELIVNLSCESEAAIAALRIVGGFWLRTIVDQHITEKLTALEGHNPTIPVGPPASALPGQIRNLAEALLAKAQPQLLAAIQTGAQARVNQLKAQLSGRIANRLTNQLNRRFSF